jgi:hypothetical protein
MSVYFSEDKIHWYPARKYQKDAFYKAKNFFNCSEQPCDTFELGSKSSGVYFYFQKCNENDILKFTRKDGSVSYLCKNPIMKMYANKDLQAEYLNNFITIPQGSTYYVNIENKPIIGWHGSYNPPCCMDGNSLI